MKKIAPCIKCKKETYNETMDWSGYCSKKCEQKRVIKRIKAIVKDHQHQKIHGMIVDVQTANMLLKIRNGLEKNGNKIKFEKMLETQEGMKRLISFGWRRTQ